MMPRLANRTPRLRAVRGNSGDPRLESLAAEFALLAQRRSRAVHEMQVLDQQRATAAAGFARLQKRMAWLVDRMDRLSPDLRAPSPTGIQIGQASAKAEITALSNDALAAIGRQWVVAHSTPQPAAFKDVRRNQRTGQR
jgi:hypothetical protein